MGTNYFVSKTDPLCPAPLLDEALFPKRGASGRHCTLGAFSVGERGASCCLPCPIQDWVYTPDWQSRLRIPNYLSILSVLLCSFLLLSFLILPSAQSHRHYLSVGMLVSVILISLSFAIPVSTKPDDCYDAITPSDMHDSMSCAWTGSLITLGGLGCVIWVFLRSLWLFLRIIYDVAPGRRFMYASIATGTLLPVVFLVAVLTSTGYSYRMGQTCLPNHENSIVTFWMWLLIFAILAFVLQSITMGYCVWIYIRTLRQERSNPSDGSDEQTRCTHMQTWRNMKKLFVLQWRNVLVCTLVLIGSLIFFIAFWTRNSRLGHAFNRGENIPLIKLWISCQTASRDDLSECRKYIQNIIIDETSVLTALILVSLIGIEIFVLLFHHSMIHAWVTLFKRLGGRMGSNWTRPQIPELTSFENPEKYSLPASNKQRRPESRFIENFEGNQTPAESAMQEGSRREIFTPVFPHDPALAPQRFTSNLHNVEIPRIHITTPSTPSLRSTSPVDSLVYPSPIRLSRPFSKHFSAESLIRRYHPSRPAPQPPSQRSSLTRSSFSSTLGSAASPISSANSGAQEQLAKWRQSTISVLDNVVPSNRPARSSVMFDDEHARAALKRGYRISHPVPGTFEHVDGAFLTTNRDKIVPSF
ncbi:hypothetical protein BKA66DRAFT_609761 [Pyrenochaeta sp. MPI-SDFR-AT-0127]|nr:hypothetical protein BKA66DRAFT_609761 [Pyrenochaeta sp. MPI-SDFR-AT-0127]